MAANDTDGASYNASPSLIYADRAPSLSYSDTATIENGSDIDNEDDDALKQEMKKHWEKHDLDSNAENASLKSELSDLQRRFAEVESERVVEREAYKQLTTTSNNNEQELEQCKMTLTKASEEAGTVDEELQRLQLENVKLRNDSDKLLLELDEAKEQSKDNLKELTLIKDLEEMKKALWGKNRTLQNKIEQMVIKNDELAAKLHASVEAAEKNAKDAKFAEAKLRNVEFDLGELRKENHVALVAKAR